MEPRKKQKLEAAGWQVGDAEDFLDSQQKRLTIWCPACDQARVEIGKCCPACGRKIKPE